MSETETTYELERIENGDTESFTLDDWLDAGGRGTTFGIIQSRDKALGDNDYADEVETVQHNPEIVERAQDEDAFFAVVQIPGWLAQDAEDLSADHPGASVRVKALVEDYSEKAFRLIATQETGLGGDHWYTWCWEFVPKSQVTVTRGRGDPFAEDRSASLEARERRDDEFGVETRGDA